MDLKEGKAEDAVADNLLLHLKLFYHTRLT